ncbi:MAG: hypothetical protein ACFB2W_06750 [Leptolyngbyaceae cyanobacterium]
MSNGNTCHKESKPSLNRAEEREYEDWKRIRSAIEHENTLVNYRQTWLLTSQAFLLTAFGSLLIASDPNQANNDFSVLLKIIPIVGLFVCALLQRSLNAAEDHIMELEQWWYYKLSLKQNTCVTRKGNNWKNFSWRNKEERTELINHHIADHPPIQGWTGYGFTRFFHYPVTPVLFIVLWFIILGFILWDSITIALLYKLLEIIAITAVILIIQLVFSRRRK